MLQKIKEILFPKPKWVKEFEHVMDARTADIQKQLAEWESPYKAWREQ